MLKNIFKIVGFFIIGMIGGIFAEQIFWPYFIERPLFYQYGLEGRSVYLTETKEVIVQENTAIIEAVEKVGKTVVGTRAKTQAGKIIEGSGLIVTSDGLVVTLASLLPQGSALSFFVEGEPIPYQVLKKDLKNDLALVKLEKTNLATAGFVQPDKIKLAERVFLVGVIFEKAKPVKSVNEGIVKSFSQDLIKTSIFEKYTLAGSPLFNVKGEVFGLNTIDSEGKVSAIPISKIKQFAGL